MIGIPKDPGVPFEALIENGDFMGYVMGFFSD